MFKLSEDLQTKTYRVDMTDANVESIAPGVLLIIGANGVRVATTDDSPTLATLGNYLIANDYYSNVKIAAIHGHPQCDVANVPAVPLTEQVGITYDFSAAVTKGDKFIIVNGLPVKPTIDTPAPNLILFEAADNSATGENTLLRPVTSPYLTQPQLYMEDGDDAGMEEGADTCVMTVRSNGVFSETGAQNVSNWTITGISDLFGIEGITWSVTYIAEGSVEITFTNPNGNIHLKSRNRINIIAKIAAFLDMPIAPPDDTSSFSYTYIEIPQQSPIMLNKHDDTGMLEGYQAGTLILGIEGATYDPVTGEDEGNWTIDASQITDEEGGASMTFTVDIAEDGSTATIAFDAGAGNLLKEGAVEISLSHEAIIGSSFGTETYTYYLPGITFQPDTGYYSAIAHFKGNELMIASDGEEAGLYEIIGIDDSVHNEEVLTLKYVSGDVLDYNGVATSMNVMLDNVDGIISAANTLSLDVEAGIDDINTQVDVALYFYWDNGGSDTTTIGTIAEIVGESPNRTITFTENAGQTTIPTGTAVTVLGGYHADGTYKRIGINVV